MGGAAPPLPPSPFPFPVPSVWAPSSGPPTPTLWAGRQTSLEQNGTAGRNVLWAEEDWRPLPPTSQEGGDEGSCWLPPPSLSPSVPPSHLHEEIFSICTETGGTTRLPPLCLGEALQGFCLEEQWMPQKWPLAFRKVRFLLLGFASTEVVEGAGGEWFIRQELEE